MTITPERRLNILYALACADALGAFAEFRSADKLKAEHPHGVSTYLPGSPFGFAPGESTDDTQMTLAILAGLANGGTVDDVADAFARWADSSPPDIGAQTRKAILALKRGGDVATAADIMGDPARHGRGNGGLMRVAGVTVAGLMGRDAIRMSARVTALTHPAPVNIVASLYLTTLIEQLAFYGSPFHATANAALYATELVLDDVASNLIDRPSGVSCGDWCDGLGRPLVSVIAARAALHEAHSLLSDAVYRGAQGYVGASTGETLATLQAALAHNASGKSWLDVASRAALGGGDADTIACVAGAIAGARGFTPPSELLNDLRVGAQWADWSGDIEPAEGGFAQMIREGRA